MIVTSRMSGTSSIVVRPGASSADAISLRALFFAPVTRTRPVRAVPPVTSKHSTRSPYGGPAAGSHRELEDPSSSSLVEGPPPPHRSQARGGTREAAEPRDGAGGSGVLLLRSRP